MVKPKCEYTSLDIENEYLRRKTKRLESLVDFTENLLGNIEVEGDKALAVDVLRDMISEYRKTYCNARH